MRLFLLAVVALLALLPFCESRKIRVIADSFQLNNSGGKLTDIYKDCGSKTGVINSVTITDCTKIPCVFERGKNYTLTLNFTSNVKSKNAVNAVYGVIAKIPVPFHLPNDDGCTMGLTCPIKAGDVLSESVTLPILTQYPSISLYVQWKVHDDQNNEMICFLFPAQLR